MFLLQVALTKFYTTYFSGPYKQNRLLETKFVEDITYFGTRFKLFVFSSFYFSILLLLGISLCSYVSYIHCA